MIGFRFACQMKWQPASMVNPPIVRTLGVSGRTVACKPRRPSSGRSKLTRWLATMGPFAVSNVLASSGLTVTRFFLLTSESDTR